MLSGGAETWHSAIGFIGSGMARRAGRLVAALGLLGALSAVTPGRAQELVLAVPDPTTREIGLLHSLDGLTWSGPERVAAGGATVQSVVAPYLSRVGRLLRMVWVDQANAVRFASGPDAAHMTAAPTPISPPGVQFPADRAVGPRLYLAQGDTETLALFNGTVTDVGQGRNLSQPLSTRLRGTAMAFGLGNFIIAAIDDTAPPGTEVTLLSSADGATWTPVPFTFTPPANTRASRAALAFEGGRFLLLVGSGPFCTAFVSTNGTSFSSIPPQNMSCLTYAEGAGIQRVTTSPAAITTFIVLGNLSNNLPAASVNLGPFRSLPSRFSIASGFGIAIGPTSPAPPPPPSCTSISATATSARTASLVIRGTTAGATYRATATGIRGVPSRLCTATGAASGTARCSLTGLRADTSYSLSATPGNCRGRLTTPP